MKFRTNTFLYKHTGRPVFGSALFFVAILFIFNSCTKEKTDIGLGIQPEEDLLNATLVDSFQLETYTELEDSVRTDELSNCLLGSYVDPVFGKTTATIYTQLGLSTVGVTVDMPSTTVDSVKIYLRYSGYYGKLTAQTFSVQRLTERFYRDSTYYSNKTLTTDGNELIVSGKETITPNTTSNVVVGSDTLNPMLVIDLKPQLGTDILNAVAGGSLASESAFSDFFYGLRLAVDNPTQAVGQGGILYFNMGDAQTEMVIYYTESSVAKQLSFPISTNQARFSNFVHDYTGTPVADQLVDKTKGQTQFYAQTMGGVKGVLKISGINGLKDLGNIIINKAEVSLPVQYYTSDPYTTTSAAFLFYNNADGGISVTLDQLSNYASYGGIYDDSKKAYTFNIGRHLQKLVKGELENLGFVINTGSSSVAGGRIIFNGTSTGYRAKPYLKVYYTKY